MKAYCMINGMIHINPTVLEQAWEELKCKEFGQLQEYDSSSNKECLIEDHIMMHMLGVILATQYSVKKGIQLFGDRGKQSATSELQQLHNMATFIPVHAHELTREQRKQALASLMFMKEKRCGRVKSRARANGSKQ